MPDPLLVTFRDARQYIPLSRRSLERLAAAGKIETRKIGSRRLVVVASLHRLARRDVPRIGPEVSE